MNHTSFLTDYRVVKAHYPESRATRVRELMKLGWVPTGGVAIQTGPHGAVEELYQAMVKKYEDV